MKSFNTGILFLIIRLFSNYSVCQEISGTRDTITRKTTIETASEKGFDIFDSEEPLTMTLCFDIREFLKTKSQPVYYDATITVKINENESFSQNIKLKARGEMRRLYCSFPPIMLKFTDNGKGKEQLLGKGTLKLVTQCKESWEFEGYLFKEYLAYKIYNLVTPYSFKTRLVRVNYVDINKPNKIYDTDYGFLIENENKMARRNNAVILNNINVEQQQMDSTEMARVAVFNYMIGNTDWSVPGQHNIKILQSPEEPFDNGVPAMSKKIPVAFDFDYSGFVDTEYAVPCGKKIPIDNVTERYYQGLCFENEKLNPIIDEFAHLKEQIASTINNFEYLSKADKKQLEYYINGFYNMYRRQNILIKNLNLTCKLN